MPRTTTPNHLTPVVLAGVAALATVAFTDRIVRWPKLALVADAAGLAVFAVIGANKALALGFSSGVALVAGVLTGTFGGLIRDILTSQVPLILRAEIYATAALAGAGLYVALAEINPNDPFIVIAPMLLTFLLRLAAVYWGWSLPTFSRGHASGADE